MLVNTQNVRKRYQNGFRQNSLGGGPDQGDLPDKRAGFGPRFAKIGGAVRGQKFNPPRPTPCQKRDTRRSGKTLTRVVCGRRWVRSMAATKGSVSPHPRISASTVRVTVLAIRSAAGPTFPAVPANACHARKQPAHHEAQCHGLKICAFCRLTCHHSAREGRVRRGIRADFGPKRA